MKGMKKILASSLVIAMVAIALVIAPMNSKAADEQVVKELDVNQDETGVIFVFDETKYNFTNLWANKTAPTREGFVFGGWYTTEDNTNFTALTQTAAAAVTDGTQVWAKFVPAEVLSVRAQLEAATETNDGANIDTVVDGEGKETTYLRLLSGVNGLGYQKVGFEILYNKTYKDPTEANNTKANNITKVYKTITNEETKVGGVETSIAASTVFGTAATHFSVLRLEGIYAANFNLVIYVRPHWTTLDGTTVYGQAKYVRVMDGYAKNHYISVPVNFLSGNDVAAGQIEISYNPTKVKLVTENEKGFDAGTLMPEMTYHDDGEGTIKIVGNISGESNSENKDVTPNSAIFANLWFKEVNTLSAGTELNFTIDDAKNSFCDWEEEWQKNLTAYDVKYLK